MEERPTPVTPRSKGIADFSHTLSRMAVIDVQVAVMDSLFYRPSNTMPLIGGGDDREEYAWRSMVRL